jgi:hypothetical protein
MKIKSVPIILALSLLSFISCQKEPSFEKAISDLKNKFPQLAKQNNKNIEYKLTRSVTNGDREFQLKLYSSVVNEYNDPQKIIILVNQESEYYAIPYLSNTHRDYWEFPNETQIPSIKKTNSTFEKELIKALDTLNLNDSKGTANIVLDELFFSLLHCVRVSEKDNNELQAIFLTSNNNIPIENNNDCSERLKKNYYAIFENRKNKKHIGNYTFWDVMNARIYQFEKLDGVKNRRAYLTLKTFRQDCAFRMITM